MASFFNLHYGLFFKYPRRVAKHLLSFFYPLVIKIFPLPKVKSVPETIEYIINKKASIARFGDSEMLYIANKLNLPYQIYNIRLASILNEILKSEEADFLVGLPDAYYDLSTMEKQIQTFWRGQIALTYPRIKNLFLKDKQYYNANISRLYYGMIDKKQSARNFENVKLIWDKRNVIIIEGEKSRLGVGNDLFSNAFSVKRILGPYHNAFDVFDELIREALKFDNDNLFLVAMGPTAKAICYYLYKNGIQAVDIGNIDLEYEWYLRGVEERIIIPGKYVSEVKGGRIVEDILDPLYESQIIAKII